MSDEIATVTIGEKEYKLEKRGIEQAQQIADLGAWLSNHGAAIFAEINSEEDDDSDDISMIIKALGALSARSLVDLFVVVVGCSKKESEEYFDFSVLVEGVMSFFDNPSIRRVIDRFFTSNASSDQTEKS